MIAEVIIMDINYLKLLKHRFVLMGILFFTLFLILCEAEAVNNLLEKGTYRWEFGDFEYDYYIEKPVKKQGKR